MSVSESTTLRYKEVAFIDSSQCFYLDVSEQNQIAILTVKGTEIWSLNCSSTTTNVYDRYFIPRSSKCPLAKYLRTPHNELMWSLDRRSLTELSDMPEAVAFLTRRPNTTIISVMDLKFSPIFKFVGYLAVLTSLGALEVYQFLDNDWQSVCDVSELYLNECAQEWKHPKCFSEWFDYLGKGKPNALCWAVHNGKLYLVVAMMNGDVLVFLEKESRFQLKTQMSSRMKPCKVYAYSFNEKLFVALGFLSGHMEAHTVDLNNAKWSNSCCLWSEEDYLEPKQIVSPKQGTLKDMYLATNKTHYLLIHKISSDTSVTHRVERFKTNVVGLTFAAGYVFVTLRDRSIVTFSLEELNVVRRISLGTALCDAGACTSNGHVIVVSSPSTLNRSRISLFTETLEHPQEELVQLLSGGKSVAELLDILWLYKMTVVTDKSAKLLESDGLSLLKLRCWVLQLLSITAREDKAVVKKVTENLSIAELMLIKNHAASKPDLQLKLDKILSGQEDLCLVCEGPITHSDMRTVQCTNHHTVPRCCISLKPCSLFNYATCMLCDAKFSTDGIATDVILNTNCPFCDGNFQIKLNLLKDYQENS